MISAADQEFEGIPHILACDIGNTNIRFACICEDEVDGLQTVAAEDNESIAVTIKKLWAELPAPKVIVASSVNPTALQNIQSAVTEHLGEDVLVVGKDVPLPIETDVEDANAVGTDRLCAAAAAWHTLNAACVVADFGSAITIDCVDEKGVFRGGAILPGIAMGAKALHDNTAQLPKVQAESPTWAFGRNTQQSIIGGLVYGARGTLRQLTEDYAAELGSWPLVILTGGDASLVCPVTGDSELVQAVVEDLVLLGIASAYYRMLADS